MFAFRACIGDNMRYVICNVRLKVSYEPLFQFCFHKYFLKIVTNFIFYAIKVIWGGVGDFHQIRLLHQNTWLWSEEGLQNVYMYCGLIMSSSLLNNIFILEILLKQKQQKQKVIIAQFSSINKDITQHIIIII